MEISSVGYYHCQLHNTLGQVTVLSKPQRGDQLSWGLSLPASQHAGTGNSSSLNQNVEISAVGATTALPAPQHAGTGNSSSLNPNMEISSVGYYHCQPHNTLGQVTVLV